MIFVDATVFMYAVGGPHPLRAESRRFLLRCQAEGAALATSAEVLQELLHYYLRSDRLAALDAAFTLVENLVAEVWTVEPEDVLLARRLVDTHPALDGRGLVLLACCRRRKVSQARTHDRALAAAFRS